MLGDEMVFHLSEQESIIVAEDPIVGDQVFFRYANEHGETNDLKITDTRLGQLLIKVVLHDAERYGG